MVAQSYVLAATSHNLHTSIMEGFDARRCKEIVRIPDRYAIPMIVATGFEYGNGDEASDEAVTPRLALDEVVFSDSFGVPYGEGDSEEGGDILQST